MKRSVFLLAAASILWAGCVPEEESDEPIRIIITDDSSSMNTSNNDDGPENQDAMPDDLKGCVDADGDGWAVDCVNFGDAQPDCDDGDPNNWASCATCGDGDGDGYFDGCDAYQGIDGPDCSDSDPNNWASCEACVDGDGDGYFVGCDAFTTIESDCADSAAGVNAGAEEIIGNGVDDDCDDTTPDDCTYTPTPATDPEPGALAGITRLHNLWRWRVGVPPLRWNETLAADAADYAQVCVWEHDPSPPNSGFQNVGENLYATTVMPNSESVLGSIQAWADERYDFDFGFTTGQTTGGQVGHYTQMVWHETTDVGCAFTWCGSGIGGLDWNSGMMLVCRYGPAGNYVGQSPYDYQEGACLDLDNDDVWQAADSDDTDRSRR